MHSVAVLLLAILATVGPIAAASPVKARTPSGTGILLLNSLPTKQQTLLRLFREPFLGRIPEIEAALLPAVSNIIAPPETCTIAIVTAKKNGWFRIIYDDGEREGWLEGRSSYRFHSWDELLRNRQVMLLAGLKKDYYQLRTRPDSTAPFSGTVEKETGVLSLRRDGDWINVMTVSQAEGWLRWRDDNGRLVISVNL